MFCKYNQLLFVPFYSRYNFSLFVLWNPNFYGALGLLALLAFIYDWIYREKVYAAYTGQFRDGQKSFKTAIENFIHYLCTLRKESQHIVSITLSLKHQ